MMPLGNNQKSCLRSLEEHKGWTRGCGWYWDTWSGTVRLMESLVTRGLAEKIETPIQRYPHVQVEYKVTPKGREQIALDKAAKKA